MFIGNLLCTLLRFDDANWKYFAFTIPTSFGQGIVNPGILFTFLAYFEHSGALVPLCWPVDVVANLAKLFRACCVCIHGLFNSVPRLGFWGFYFIDNSPKYVELRPRGGPE